MEEGTETVDVEMRRYRINRPHADLRGVGGPSAGRFELREAPWNASRSRVQQDATKLQRFMQLRTVALLRFLLANPQLLLTQLPISWGGGFSRQKLVAEKQKTFGPVIGMITV
jgi:hypothetical protein